MAIPLWQGENRQKYAKQTPRAAEKHTAARGKRAEGARYALTFLSLTKRGSPSSLQQVGLALNERQRVLDEASRSARRFVALSHSAGTFFSVLATTVRSNSLMLHLYAPFSHRRARSRPSCRSCRRRRIPRPPCPPRTTPRCRSWRRSAPRSAGAGSAQCRAPWRRSPS